MTRTLLLAAALVAGITARAQSQPPQLRPLAGRTPGTALRTPTSFDTALADGIVSNLQVFPADNAWNADIRNWPLHPNSANIVASVGTTRKLRMNSDMNYVLVPPNQPLVPFDNNLYPDEADHGPFPIPANLPIEGWPTFYKDNPDWANLTLDDIQRDSANIGGDRHAIVVDPTNRVAYEFFQMKKTNAGWEGYSAKFDLKTNALRPAGWTSADAAGLPIFPAIVRHDELARGAINHALRMTVRRTRRAYVAPATHFASMLTDPNLPRMGERFRLKAGFDTSSFSPQVRVVLEAMKKHGILVADNGIEWAISVAPDPRIAVMHEEFSRIFGDSFEVVVAP